MSAWASKNQLVLGQQKVDEKSNEITAIPKLLQELNIAGAVITMDATCAELSRSMGYQTAVAKQIIEQKADYMLSLKGNQGALHRDVQLFFESEKTCPKIGYESHDGEHGRYETRTVRASSDIDWLKKAHPKWEKLTRIVAITAKRECKGKVTDRDTVFYQRFGRNRPQTFRASCSGALGNRK